MTSGELYVDNDSIRMLYAALIIAVAIVIGILNSVVLRRQGYALTIIILYILLILIYYFKFSPARELAAIFAMSVTAGVVTTVILQSIKYLADIKKYKIPYKGMKKMLDSFYSSPSCKNIEKVTIEADGTVIEMTLPEQTYIPNDGKRSTRRFKETEHYHKVNDLGLPEKYFFIRTWDFRKKRIIASDIEIVGDISLLVSVQKTESADFSMCHEICGEAYRLVASKFGKEGVKFESRNGRKVFQTIKINDYCFVQYTYKSWYFDCTMLHIPIDTNAMLTIEIRYNPYWESEMSENDLLRSIMGEFIENMLSGMDLHIEGIRIDMECKSLHDYPNPPDLEYSSNECIDEQKYKVMLRNKAVDPLEWFLFEYSGVFYTWFDDQYEKVVKSYEKNRTRLLQDKVNKYKSSLHTLGTAVMEK